MKKCIAIIGACILTAWTAAAQDLAIEVVSPFALLGVDYAAWLPDFGGGKGTLIDWTGSGNDSALAASEGYFVSALNPASYASYDRDMFTATLDDWGWHGDPGRRPDWFTGRAWTD